VSASLAREPLCLTFKHLQYLLQNIKLKCLGIERVSVGNPPFFVWNSIISENFFLALSKFFSSYARLLVELEKKESTVLCSWLYKQPLVWSFLVVLPEGGREMLHGKTLTHQGHDTLLIRIIIFFFEGHDDQKGFYRIKRTFGDPDPPCNSK